MLRVRCCRPAKVRAQAALDGGVEMVVSICRGQEKTPSMGLQWWLKAKRRPPNSHVSMFARETERIAELIRRIKRDTEKQVPEVRV